MSQETEKKRRKVYLNTDEPFVVPRTTRWYNDTRLSTGATSATPDSVPDASQMLGASQDQSRNSFSSADELLNSADCSDPVCCAHEADYVDHASDASNGAATGDDESDSDDDASSQGDAAPFFDETETLSECFSNLGNQTLPGSGTTVAAAIVLIMAFVVAHGLTWNAVDDLLKLIDALFGAKKTGLPGTKYLLRKLWVPKCKGMTKSYYYCDACTSLLEPRAGGGTLRCELCKTTSTIAEVKKKGCLFVIMDMKEQLRHIVAQTKDALYSNLCKLKERMDAGTTALSGIADGSACKALRQDGKVRWSDLTLTVNTDGSPLFKSTNASIWPIQFFVNELPFPSQTEHTVLAGLWFGHKHPDMLLFLSKFVEEVKAVGELMWKCGSAELRSKVYPVCVCVDAPARAAVGNHTQFNGQFGCPWCLACGKLDDKRRLYLETEPSVQRTTEGVQRDAKLAMQLDTPVNGVKGPSPLTNLPYLDLVWCYTVEYMHCVLLGVVRQFTEYWVDSVNSNEDYYIGQPSTLQAVSKRLLRIRPPHHITRLPRTLRARCFWKAHEWRNWLLFYCLPCCWGILPPVYLKHFAFLSEAIFILLQDELSDAAITHADRLLREFVDRAARLYGDHCMTFNVHQLTHLAQAARKYGPLWAHSAFTFESGNGRIVKLVTAANGVKEQIVERVVMHQELQLLLSLASFPPSVKQLCQDFLGYPRLEKAYHVGGACMFGRPKRVLSLSSMEAASVNSLVGDVHDVQEHFRFAYAGTVFHSKEYKRSGKRDSAVFEAHDGGCFVIKRVLEVTDAHSTANGEAILLCGKVVREYTHADLPDHISDCFFSRSQPVIALKLSAIAKPCVFVSFGDREDFICTVPNFIERD